MAQVANRRSITAIYASLVAWFSTCAFATEAICATPKSADWKVIQKSRTFGIHTVLISPNAFRISNKKSGITYLAKAPNWDVYITNDITKVYHVQKFDKFQRLGTRAMVLFGEPVFTSLKMKPTTEKVSSAGQDCVAYVTTPESERFQIREVEEKRQNKRAAISAHLKLSHKISSGDRAGIILERIYGLPELKGIPMEFMYKTLIGKQKLELSTEKAEQVKFKPSDFAMQSSYRKVAKQEDVFQDGMGTASMDNMIRNMERGGEFNYDLESGFGHAQK